MCRELPPTAGPKSAFAEELDVRRPPSPSARGRPRQQPQSAPERIDYLFNNAGIAVGGEVNMYRLADWNDVFDVNLGGVVHGIQAVYPIIAVRRARATS